MIRQEVTSELVIQIGGYANSFQTIKIINCEELKFTSSSPWIRL